MTNKELVKQFYQHVFINGEIDKIPEYVIEDYIQLILELKLDSKILLIFSESNFN